MAGVFHGGRLDAAIAQYGGKREDWLDLSTGINPNAYPIPEIPSDAWARLPDAQAERDLLDAAREYYQVADGFEIVAAPGTQAIIELLPRVLKADNVSIAIPTYAEHEHAWRKAGTGVTSTDSLASNSDALVVVNPNNPTAHVCARDALRQASEKVRCLIVDEAFADPVPEVSLVPEMSENAIVLKSFGKFFGLAGLRLGFAICNSDTANRLRTVLGPWAVSGPALEIGKAAFRDKHWISTTIDRLQNDSIILSNILKNKRFIVEGVNPLFVSVHHQNAKGVYEFLARRNILTRPFPDREGYLRFGLCQDHQMLSRLEEALEAYANA